MNQAHLELLASDGWREVLRDLALPFALDGLSYADLGDDVLEIGPGPGLTTDLLHPSLPALTALELDADLAAALADRLEGTTVTVEHGDATAMPFADGRFSAVVTFTMLHHVPTCEQQDQVFAEVARVLRPGGVFVANDSVASDELEELHDGDVYNPVDPADLAERLERAGLHEITVRSNPFAWAAQARA